MLVVGLQRRAAPFAVLLEEIRAIAIADRHEAT